MHTYDEAAHVARLVNLEGSVLALLRETSDDHDAHDGLRIVASSDPNIGLVIELEYTRGGMAVAGESI